MLRSEECRIGHQSTLAVLINLRCRSPARQAQRSSFDENGRIFFDRSKFLSASDAVCRLIYGNFGCENESCWGRTSGHRNLSEPTGSATVYNRRRLQDFATPFKVFAFIRHSSSLSSCKSRQFPFHSQRCAHFSPFISVCTALLWMKREARAWFALRESIKL